MKKNNSSSIAGEASESSKKSLTDRLYKAGEVGLASFSSPAAGALGCAAMFASALLISKWTGNTGGESLQGLQGMLGMAGAAVLGVTAVGVAVVGAVQGFIGKGVEKAQTLSSSLKTAAGIAAGGVGAAVLTGGAIMAVNGLTSVAGSASNPWVAGAAIGGVIASGLVSISGSLMGPLGVAYVALDSSSKAISGTGMAPSPEKVEDFAERLRERKERAVSNDPHVGGPKPSVA